MKLIIVLFLVSSLLFTGCSSATSLSSNAETSENSTEQTNNSILSISDISSAASLQSSMDLYLTQKQKESLGAKYYPAPVKRYETSPACWETEFDFKSIIQQYAVLDLYACAYVTVLGATTGELSFKGDSPIGWTYYELKVDKVVCGNVEQGQTVIVSNYGYYDTSTESWVNTHPGFVPLKSGDQFLTVLYGGDHVLDAIINYYLPNALRRNQWKIVFGL